MFLELLILHLVGGAISLFGGLMLWRHRAQWNSERTDDQIEPGEKRFLYGQYRRRMQSSAMIVMLGLLIHASNEHLVAWQRAPVGFFVYVCLMLVLVVWIIILALGDFLACQIVHRSALARLREQQQQLENAVLELKRNRGP